LSVHKVQKSFKQGTTLAPELILPFFLKNCFLKRQYFEKS